MKIDSMPHASREVARWRALFRPTATGMPASRAGSAPPFEDTEWAHTEWSETQSFDGAVDLDLERQA